MRNMIQELRDLATYGHNKSWRQDLLRILTSSDTEPLAELALRKAFELRGIYRRHDAWIVNLYRMVVSHEMCRYHPVVGYTCSSAEINARAYLNTLPNVRAHG